MVAYAVENLKNVCIAGHGTTGKTTLAESFMFNIGITNRQGVVENGNTISDFTEEETSRGISISTAVLSAEYKKNMISFVDTPGYFDFAGELYSALPFCESVLLTLKASSGIDVGTEKAFNLAKKFNKSIAFVVNEIDRDNLGSMEELISDMESELGVTLAPMTFPLTTGQSVNAVIDIVKGKVFKYANGKRAGEEAIPANMSDKIEELKLKLMEAVAESDEALMEKYFAEGALSEEEIQKGLVNAFAMGTIFPVFFAAPNKGIGVDCILDAIADYFPTPAVKNELCFADGTKIAMNSAESFKSIVFKVNLIPQFGEVFIMKALQGEISEGADVYNNDTQTVEKFSQLFIIRGKERIPTEKVTAGQIFATVKLKNSKTGDQIIKDKSAAPFTHQLIEWPEAIVRGAFAGESKEDTDKVATALRKIQIEDASFKVFSDPELKQLIVSGLGELHLEVIAKKVLNQFKIKVKIEEPKIPYRETIRGTADVRYRHKKQSGGAGQFAEVAIKLEPSEQEFEFVDAIVGGVVAGRFIPAVEKGIRDTMANGPLAGCKFMNCKVTLYDGKMHEVDSDEMSFKIAASMAFKDAVKQAKPIILEPIYNVEITVPDEFAGSVMGDISSRRGKPQGMESAGRYQTVKAQVPLKELHGYSTQLRSMTNGRGTYTVSFSHYDPVPGDIQKKIVEEYERSKEQ